MIVLFTDFGLSGPYVGQVKAVLYRLAPAVPVVDLFADAPTHDPRASAYLLASFRDEFPVGTVFECVVDPGVGSARAALAVEADGRWFVGPDNGLFATCSPLPPRASPLAWLRQPWVPPRSSPNAIPTGPTTWPRSFMWTISVT